MGLGGKLRRSRARPPKPADSRSVAGQLPEPSPGLFALSAHGLDRGGRLAAARRVRGLGSLDGVRRTRLEGDRHPRGHCALPNTARSPPFPVVATARRALREASRSPSHAFRRTAAQSPVFAGAAAAQGCASGAARGSDGPTASRVLLLILVGGRSRWNAAGACGRRRSAGVCLGRARAGDLFGCIRDGHVGRRRQPRPSRRPPLPSGPPRRWPHQRQLIADAAAGHGRSRWSTAWSAPRQPTSSG